MLVEDIEHLAAWHDWTWLDHQPESRMISFTKIGSDGRMRINVYYTTMTVATVLNHPKQGRTQLFRKGVTPLELDAIFTNPRIHLNKGYKRR
jgi:hypothetical protein